jgi:hypothetical protein
LGGWLLFENSVLEETRWIVWSLTKIKRKLVNPFLPNLSCTTSLHL